MSAEEDLNQERRITFCMYECWEKLAGEAGLPALKNMNREEIAPFKKNLVLIDLRSGHDNPTFQVIGSELQEDLDEDLSNKHVSNVPRRTMLSRVTDHYLEVMANRVPIAFEAEFVNTDSEKALYRGILLPFSDDGENINFILGGVRWILEKDVTLDDSKPTIEELMRSISNGREDAPVQYDEAAVAAEQGTPDTVAEDYSDPDAGTLNEDLDEDMALSEDDFDAVGEEEELGETGEDAADDIDLAAEDLMEDDDQTGELTPVEDSDSEIEELIENIDEETELSEDGFNVVTDADPVEPTGDEPIIETDALEDVAPEDPVIEEDPITLENKPSFFTDAPGITRKDFVPAADEAIAEEAEDEDELIGDVEHDLLADPEQQDDSAIFTETDQPDETLFDNAEEESDPVSDEGNFAEIFDTEDEAIEDDAQPATESDLAPVEEDAFSFVESLEKELYSHTDEIDVEEELVSREAEEASDDTGDEHPASDGGADMETESILETPEEKDDIEESLWDTASTNDEPEEELVAENTDELVDESDDAYTAKSTRELTLNELLSEDVDDDDAEADEDTEVETINEQDGVLIAQEATEDAPEEDEVSELVMDDEYLEIDDGDAFEDKIIEDLIDEDAFDLPDTLAEVHDPAPETAGVEQEDVPSTDDLSIEELMESIISERKFEISHESEDSKEVEEVVEAMDASDLEMDPAEIEEGVLEENALEEYTVEEYTVEEYVVESSIEDVEEDIDEEVEQDLIEIREEDVEEGLTEDRADDSVNEAWQDQDASDTPITTEVDVVSSPAIEQEPPTVDDANIELEEVAQAPIAADVPQEKPKRSSVIERAMEMMAPNFSRPKDPVAPDIPDMSPVESMDVTATIDETPQPMDGEDATMGSAESMEEDVSVDVASEPMDDEVPTMDSVETTEEEITVDAASEPTDNEYPTIGSGDITEEDVAADATPEPDHADQYTVVEIEEEDDELAYVSEDLSFAEPEITAPVSARDDTLHDVENDAERSTDQQPAAEAQTKSLEELRATLKQIIGYIKKEDKNHNRSRDSLYNILTAIYEFHDTCEGSTDAYNTIVSEHGLKVQSRAPFTPVLKICLGKDYDKTRLTEYAAALGIARYMNVDISEFHAFIKNFPGGIKGCVKEMRAIRKHGTSGNITARKTRSVEEAREILRDMAPIASFRLKKIIVGNNVDEFCLLLAKRDGHDINVLKILDEKYTKLDPIIKRAAFIKGNLNDRK